MSAERGSADPVGGEGPARPRVLVVDDDADMRQMTLLLIRRFGYEVEAVENGAKAVEAVRTGGYRLVLMDVEMPGMDGLEATRQIRALSLTGGQPRIIAVTGDHAPGDRAKCFTAGMDGHVAKPFLVEGLESAIPGWIA